MNLHLLPTIMPRVDVDIKLNHFFETNFLAPDFYLMGSISTRSSNSQLSDFFKTSACTYYHDKKTISVLPPSYQSVLAEFSRLLRTYIIFSGRASFNWDVNCQDWFCFYQAQPMTTTGHKDPAGIYSPLACQR